MGARALAHAGLVSACLSLVATALAGGPHEDYVLYCMGCHGPAGAGVPGHVPPLAGNVALFLRSAEGREYLTRVPGAANSPLSDARLADVYNWALAHFDGAHALVPLTSGEVSAHRHLPLADVKSRRRAIIESLRASGAAPGDTY